MKERMKAGLQQLGKRVNKESMKADLKKLRKKVKLRTRINNSLDFAYTKHAELKQRAMQKAALSSQLPIDENPVAQSAQDTQIGPNIFLIGALVISALDFLLQFQRGFDSPFFYLYSILAVATITLSLGFDFSKRSTLYSLATLAVIHWFMPYILVFLTAFLPGERAFLSPLFFPLWFLYYLFFLAPVFPRRLGKTVYTGVFLLIFVPLITPLVFQTVAEVNVPEAISEVNVDVDQARGSVFSSFTNAFNGIVCRASGTYCPITAETPLAQKQGYYLSTSLGDTPLNQPTYYQPDIPFRAVIQEHNESIGTALFTRLLCSAEKDDELQTSHDIMIEHIPNSFTVLTCPFTNLEQGKHTLTLTATYAFGTQAGFRTYWMERDKWVLYNSQEERRRACGNPSRPEVLNQGFSRHGQDLTSRTNVVARPPLTFNFADRNIPLIFGANTPFLFSLHKEHDGDIATLNALSFVLPPALRLSDDMSSASCPFTNNAGQLAFDTSYAPIVVNNLNEQGQYVFSCGLEVAGNTPDCSIADFLLETNYTFSISTQQRVTLEEEI